MTQIKSKVLLVDDEPEIRTLLKDSLSQLPVEIFEASDGQEAWTFLNENPVDLVLTDLRMPNMNGMELCRKIAEVRLPISMIIITGFGGKNECLSAFKYGVFDLIEKPFEAELIINRVKNALEKRSVANAINIAVSTLAKELDIKKEINLEQMTSYDQIKLLKAITSIASMRIVNFKIAKNSVDY